MRLPSKSGGGMVSAIDKDRALAQVLSGMNEEEHIKENIRIASESLPESLTEQEISIIEKVRSTYQDLMRVGCTGCAYCMPCPAGINIPSAFKNLNNYYMFGKAGVQGRTKKLRGSFC
jgi:uncharacterized protein